MPHLSTRTKKYLRYSLTGILMLGMILVTGFLSFTGMLALNASIYYAIAAFFLAGGIEGEVYAQNISSSLLKIFSGNHLEDRLLNKKLAQLINSEGGLTSSKGFLADYKKLLNYVQDLEETHDESNEHALEEARRSLKWMQRYFKDFMLNNQATPDGLFHPELQLLISDSEKERLRKEIRRKTWQNRFSWILNLAAGISCGLVGLEVAQSSILALTAYFGLAISSAALSASIFGLALLGAIGFTHLIHNTISDMIQNDTLQKWARKTVDFFKRKSGETNFRYWSRVIFGSLAVSLVVGLGVFATVSTAGTWWYAAKAGAQLIPGIRNAASAIRTGAVSLMGITTLAFNIVNSLKSAKELSKISIHHAWQHVKKQVEDCRKTENLIQFLNPLRLVIKAITFPFKTLIFIGHLISMGDMGRLPGIDDHISTGINFTSELLTDFHMIFPEDPHQTGEHHHPLKHKQDACPQTANASASELEEKTHVHPPEQAHRHKHHDHTHTDIAGKFLKLVLSPLYILAAFWDCYSSQYNPEPEKQLSMKQALKKSFFGLSKKVELKKPTLSTTWLVIEKQKRIEKTKQKYGAALKNHQEAKPTDWDAINELQTELCNSQYDGTINSSTFFQNRDLSKAAKTVCEKMLEKANASQYQLKTGI